MSRARGASRDLARARNHRTWRLERAGKERCEGGEGRGGNGRGLRDRYVVVSYLWSGKSFRGGT